MHLVLWLHNNDFHIPVFQTIERKGRTYTPLNIPKSLQKVLPFRDTPKALAAQKETTQRAAVIREPHEAKVPAVKTVTIVNVKKCNDFYIFKTESSME